jgi:hypothetical protein
MDQSFEKSLPEKFSRDPKKEVDPAVANLGHGCSDLKENLLSTIV